MEINSETNCNLTCQVITIIYLLQPSRCIWLSLHPLILELNPQPHPSRWMDTPKNQLQVSISHSLYLSLSFSSLSQINNNNKKENLDFIYNYFPVMEWHDFHLHNLIFQMLKPVRQQDQHSTTPQHLTMCTCPSNHPMVPHPLMQM